MARGGVRPGAGHPKGKKNRSTLERENAALAEKLRTKATKRTDLDVMLELRDFWLGIVLKEHREAKKAKRNLNLALLAQATEYAGSMASKRAPFLHAKLSSVTVRDDPLDLSRCTDDELAILARIRARTAVSRGDTARDGQTAH